MIEASLLEKFFLCPDAENALNCLDEVDMYHVSGSLFNDSQNLSVRLTFEDTSTRHEFMMKALEGPEFNYILDLDRTVLVQHSEFEKLEKLAATSRGFAGVSFNQAAEGYAPPERISSRDRDQSWADLVAYVGSLNLQRV